ncbi:MAG TPA: hypothetical protein ENH40_05245 [Nitrospirae bacterium]|nr:hypothetical protein [Nitrospirota bacterium]
MSRSIIFNRTGNTLITLGILTYPIFLMNPSMEGEPFFWGHFEWIVFFISYFLISAGFIFRGTKSGNSITVEKATIFIYMSGFFILFGLWEWQKTIPDPSGTYIAYLIYFAAFFYPIVPIIYSGLK